MVASVLLGKFLDFTLFQPLISMHFMFFLFAGFAGIMILGMNFVAQPPAKEMPSAGYCDKIKAGFMLWTNPIIWCLGVVNVLFGFCAAYMNGYVNGRIEAKNPV